MANTVFLQLIEDKLGTLTKSEKKIAEDMDRLIERRKNNEY